MKTRKISIIRMHVNHNMQSTHTKLVYDCSHTKYQLPRRNGLLDVAENRDKYSF
jgi:hypothetical protein